jgi:hypothetical protein
MEPHSTVPVDLVEEPLEELSPVILAVADCISLVASQDGEELGPSLEVPLARLDALALASGLDSSTSEREAKERPRDHGEVRERPNRTHC